MVAYRIDASPTAAHLMSQVPGLRHRVEGHLAGILETALEFKRLQGTAFLDDREEPMRTVVGNYSVSYQLDLARSEAKVVFVEMLPREVQRQDPRDMRLRDAGAGEAREDSDLVAFAS